jgi:hypothetical protein
MFTNVHKEILCFDLSLSSVNLLPSIAIKRGEIMKILLISLLLTMSSLANSADSKKYLLASLPAWTDQYDEIKKADYFFLNISTVMKDFSIDRLQAMETQRKMREILRQDPNSNKDEAMDIALNGAKNSIYEKVDRKRLEAAKFIIVFDLDETLYDQGLSKNNLCAQITIKDSAGVLLRKIYVDSKFEEVLQKINDLGGAVVLFTANLAQKTKENLKNWKIQESNAYDSPLIAGILANDYLTMIPKNDSENNPVKEPSKDLRLLDESLSKVILVDDNANRIFQMSNYRSIKKLDGDLICNNPNSTLINNLMQNRLINVLTEIEESVGYMNSAGSDFKRAYLPYTVMGNIVLRELMANKNMAETEAIAQIRANPSVVDLAF